jgi:(5-formylfuran-3-yl)methyl phosphate synthase
MRLLISVADAVEAAAALAGGADLIDAKDPLAGALGAVTPAVVREIHSVVAGARPVTAALGDADDEAAVECAARTHVLAGAALVKVGFAGIMDERRIAALLAAAVRGAAAACGGVVAVGYADASRVAGIAPAALTTIAADTGAAGVLIDTFDKSGPGLRALVDAVSLASFVAGAHSAGMFVALAGKLAAGDLIVVRDTGADIAGVRGAACAGGRIGPISADRVRALRGALGTHAPTGLRTDAAPCSELTPSRAAL